jgi:hypothetical protein
MAWAAAHPTAFASATLINIGVLPGYHWHYLARIWRTPLLGELFNGPRPGPGSGCCCATATRAGCPGPSSTACTPT